MSNRYSYYLTPLAKLDIEQTLDYISENLCNEKAARDLFAEIEKAIQNICQFPFSSATCECFLITDQSIRHVPVDNYCLVYEVDEKGKQINILRFCFAKMDLINLLRGA